VLGLHFTGSLFSFEPRHSGDPNSAGWTVTSYDYSDGIMVCVALIGLVLYFIGSYRAQKES
jgi:hypothetical protein